MLCNTAKYINLGKTKKCCVYVCVWVVSVSKLQGLSVYSEMLNNIVCLKLKCMLLFDTYIFVIEQWEWQDGHPSGQCHLWEKGKGFGIKEEYTGPSPGPGELPFFSWVVGSCLSIILLFVLVCPKYFTIFYPFFPLISPSKQLFYDHDSVWTTEIKH